MEGLSLNGPEDAAMLAELYGPATEIFVEGLGDLLSDEDVATLRGCVAGRRAVGAGQGRAVRPGAR